MKPSCPAILAGQAAGIAGKSPGRRARTAPRRCGVSVPQNCGFVKLQGVNRAYRRIDAGAAGAAPPGTPGSRLTNQQRANFGATPNSYVKGSPRRVAATGAGPERFPAREYRRADRQAGPTKTLGRLTLIRAGRRPSLRRPPHRRRRRHRRRAAPPADRPRTRAPPHNGRRPDPWPRRAPPRRQRPPDCGARSRNHPHRGYKSDSPRYAPQTHGRLSERPAAATV